jgi:hypothetical protein
MSESSDQSSLKEQFSFMSKRARPDSTGDEALDALKECVAKANSLLGPFQWFVCRKCNKLCLGYGNDLPTTDYNDTALFCPDCTLFCKKCQLEYVPSMWRYHADCVEPEDEEEEEEEGKVEKDAVEKKET